MEQSSGLIMKTKSTLITLILIFSVWLLFTLGCKDTNLDKINNKKEEPKVESTETPEPKITKESSDGKVTKQEFGKDWAFSVDEGVLSCNGKNGIGGVIFAANGKTYAVNGVAKSTKEYLPIEDIWLDDPQWANIPEMKGVKIDIGPFIKKGLELCK